MSSATQEDIEDANDIDNIKAVIKISSPILRGFVAKDMQNAVEVIITTSRVIIIYNYEN